MSKDFVSVNNYGAIFSTFKWPKGITLTDDEKKRIGRRVREAKRRAPKGEPFDITPSFIVEQFLKQCGRCYFSKKPMTWVGNDYNTVSISRVDPDGPYTQENVVLCTLIVANMRNSYSYETTLKYCGAVVNYALSLNDVRLSQRQDEDHHLMTRAKSIYLDVVYMDEKNEGFELSKNERKPRRKDVVSRKERDEDRVYAAKFTVKKCYGCDRYLPLDSFSKRTVNNPGPDGLEAKCKDCERKRSLLKSEGLIPLLKEKVTSAKIRSIEYSKVCDLANDIALALLNDQRGLCYYTGIPMKGVPGNLDNVSIDRINPTKPYIKSNIALWCEAINIMKNEMSFVNFLDYCQALVDKPLSLDDPRLRSRPNESSGAKLRKAALKRKTDLDGITIERHGLSGFSAGNSLPDDD